MESVSTVLIFLAVISLSIYLTYYSADTSSSNMFDKILTFCLPFISTLVIGIVVINKFIYLPIVITASIIAGVVSLLVSLRAENRYSARQPDNLESTALLVMGYPAETSKPSRSHEKSNPAQKYHSLLRRTVQTFTASKKSSSEIPRA